jgi:hypothetical protein
MIGKKLLNAFKSFAILDATNAGFVSFICSNLVVSLLATLIILL